VSWRRKKVRAEFEPGIMERAVEALEGYRQLVEEERAFVREVMRRSEKVAEDLMQSEHERRSEAVAHFAEADARLRDLSDASKAQQKGLFRAIDRLPPPDDPR
jgi:hypothetical protein